MATPTRIGGTFLINAVTAGSQVRSSAEGLANGRLLVTYESLDGATTADWNIYGQIMSGSGTTIPSSFMIHPASAAQQQFKAVTQLANGNLLAVWTSQSGTLGDTSQRAVHGQIFTTSGTKVGSSFRVNGETANDQVYPSVTALKAGGFVVAWADSSGIGGDASNYGIKARVYSASGTAGAEFLVNTTTPGSQNSPHVTAMDNGGFAVTWFDSGASGGNAEAYVQRGRIYDASGTAVSAELALDVTRYNTLTPSQVVGLTGGDVAFVWVSNEAGGGDASGSSIRTAVYSATGALKEAEVQVNTTTTGNQNAPTAVALRDGRYMVAWVDASPGAGNEVIRAQVMNADGTKSFSQFTVHNSDYKGGTAPNLTKMADGRVFISWSDPDTTTDGSETAIVGQYIDPRTAAISLTGTAGGDRYQGSAFADKIWGVGGNDLIYGGRGNDSVSGGDGNDSLSGGASGADKLYGGNGADKLYGGSNLDTLYGGAGNDTAYGGTSADKIYGGSDADVLYGDSNTDYIYGGDGNDTASGGTGNDTVEGGGGADKLYGGSSGNDKLYGGTSADTLYGGAGNDTIYGGTNSDKIYGGSGTDLLSGGTGYDDFIFATASEIGKGSTRDQITSFSTGTDDIVLTGFMAGGQFIGGSAFSGNDDDVRYVKSTGILSGDVNGDKVADWEIYIANKGTMAAGDFIF